MADKSTPPKPASPEGERIAKVLSRRGIASRREAERLIEAGEVTVNGKRIDSPALNVTSRDRITVSGKPLPEEEPARLWLYYKPEGLVTSASDEKGRDTVFDHLPEDMPRVMSIGRLDLNSEGLLLLTNDGELKRRLELPSTGWLRKYRVRVNGNPTDPDLEPLRKGITVDGERFQPMQVTLDRVQGANAWVTVGLREGKNREIRRAMNAIDLYVNRLIRTSYGPFRLGDLQPGEVEEVRPRVLRDQLGQIDAEGEEAPKPRRTQTAPRSSAGTKVVHSRRPPRRDEDAPRRDEDDRAPLPKRPGDGVKLLSNAWGEAVRPRRPGEAGAAPSRTEAEPTGRRPAKPGVDRSRSEAPARKPFSTKPGTSRSEAPSTTGRRPVPAKFGTSRGDTSGEKPTASGRRPAAASARSEAATGKPAPGRRPPAAAGAGPKPAPTKPTRPKAPRKTSTRNAPVDGPKRK